MIATSLESLLTAFLDFLPHIIVALVTLGAALVAFKPIARWVERAARRAFDNEETAQLLSRLAKWIVLGGGTVVALEQVNFDITGFVAGLGIASIALGFALQDIARNFVSGLLLFARRPFEVGDAVKISGFSGVVQEITTQDTVIKTWDGELVTLRNMSVLSSPIINYSRLPPQRHTVSIRLKYSPDSEAALKVFRDTIVHVPGVLQDPPPDIYVTALSSAAFDLTAYFWVDGQKQDPLQVHSNVVLAMRAAAERESITLL